MLGPGCSDPYNAPMNSGQMRLGPRSDVNATAGLFPYPYTIAFQTTGDPVYKRCQVAAADLLVHLVDATSREPLAAVAAVREVLAEIEADHVPELVVLNKADQISPEELERLKAATGAELAISRQSFTQATAAFISSGCARVLSSLQIGSSGFAPVRRMRP